MKKMAEGTVFTKNKFISRRSIETAGILLAFILVAVLLDFHGRHQIRHAVAPVIKQIASPQMAFPLWQKNHLYGRTLLLFDRYLNADDAEPRIALFDDQDFNGPAALKRFCVALYRDGFLDIRTAGCNIVALNELLRSHDISDRLVSMKGLQVSDNLEDRMDAAEGYRDVYSSLPEREKKKLTRLNRDLLEMAYPGLCPERPGYGLTAENYNFLAVKYGVVRRIIHVIPVEAWPEAERNLEALPWATREGRVFRVDAPEGTPVDVMRIGDLPRIPEMVLVNFNADRWRDQEIDSIIRLFTARKILTDFLTISGKRSGELIRRLTKRGNPQN